MTWFGKFFNKKNSEEYELIKSEIPFSTLTRWYLYDMSVENPNEFAVELGLTPVSEEGNEKEQEDSSGRLSELTAILPYLNIISELNAKVITLTQLMDLKKDTGIDEDISDDVKIMKELYYAVGLSALISAFSSAIELGIIYPNAIGVGSVYKEYDDE